MIPSPRPRSLEVLPLPLLPVRCCVASRWRGALSGVAVAPWDRPIRYVMADFLEAPAAGGQGDAAIPDLKHRPYSSFSLPPALIILVPCFVGPMAR